MASSVINSEPALDIIIRPYQSADAEAVTEHLQKCFRLDSPFFSGLDMSEDESAPFFHYLTQEAEKADVSYEACDKKASSPKPVIIGCVLASIEDGEGSERVMLTYLQMATRKQKTFIDFADQMFAAPLSNFSVARVLKLRIFSVASEFRRQQLCRRMVRRCIEDAAVKKSCGVAVVLATSYKSQALMQDEKFVTVNTCYFDDYNKKQKDGKHMFVMKDPLNTTAKVMAKILIERGERPHPLAVGVG